VSGADAGLTLVRDREPLVSALRERGVDYLAPSDAQGPPLADGVLIASLAAHHDPRLRQALIALFMLHQKKDSQEFALNFEALRALWHPAGGTR
jgi:hypothetical protein